MSPAIKKSDAQRIREWREFEQEFLATNLELMTPCEAAEYLEVTQEFLRHKRKYWRLYPAPSFIKFRRSILYWKRDLDEYALIRKHLEAQEIRRS